MTTTDMKYHANLIREHLAMMETQYAQAEEDP